MFRKSYNHIYPILQNNNNNKKIKWIFNVLSTEGAATQMRILVGKMSKL